MDASQPSSIEVERELETWDWARAAGVSAEQLLQALQASFAAPGGLARAARPSGV